MAAHDADHSNTQGRMDLLLQIVHDYVKLYNSASNEILCETLMRQITRPFLLLSSRSTHVPNKAYAKLMLDDVFYYNMAYLHDEALTTRLVDIMSNHIDRVHCQKCKRLRGMRHTTHDIIVLYTTIMHAALHTLQLVAIKE